MDKNRNALLRRLLGRKRPETSAEPHPPASTAFPATAPFEEQIAHVGELFRDVDILITRRFQGGGAHPVGYCLFYCDGLVDSAQIHDFIIRPLQRHAPRAAPGRALQQELLDLSIMSGEAKISDDPGGIPGAITYGDAALFVEGCPGVILLGSKGFTLRSIQEPESEKVLSGPREGFCEGLMTNLSLISRRLRTSDLKMKMRAVGRKSQTQVCLCYLDTVVNKTLLDEVNRQLDGIDIDAILDSNYIAELISPISLLGYNTCGVTERPDIIAGKLLEGRIAILVDGSPAVLTLPYLFIENFQSNEDYYVNRYYATFSRILRIVGCIMTILVPAFYVAVVTHHHEIIPTPLLLNIASERENVPLPAALEALLLLLTFDILRETGIRMPTGIGQALSIVGALVIGQSAVEAGLVSAPMIIVVAFTGITNLLVPKMSAPALVARYGLLLLASAFGLFGVALGVTVEITHVLCVKSLGTYQMDPIENLTKQRRKDLFTRVSWRRMLTRLAPVSGNSRRAANAEPGGEQL